VPIILMPPRGLLHASLHTFTYRYYGNFVGERRSPHTKHGNKNASVVVDVVSTDSTEEAYIGGMEFKLRIASVHTPGVCP